MSSYVDWVQDELDSFFADDDDDTNDDVRFQSNSSSKSFYYFALDANLGEKKADSTASSAW